MDWVRIRLTYDDSIEETYPMQRWLAEVFCWLFAAGYEWTPGLPVRRARLFSV
jgi:hypothetical protein